MPICLITGANRGIGLEFVRQYAAEGWRVIATCRAPDAARVLETMPGEVHIHALDVRNADRIRALAEAIEDDIDLLINNAGISGKPHPAFGAIDPQVWAEVHLVNAIAPVLVSQAFLPHLLRGSGKRIVAISTRMGSIGDNSAGGAYAYRASKAALNMAFKCMSLDLAAQRIAVAIFHPGHVRTDMGGPGAPVLPRDSVAGMRKVIAALTPERTGRFWNYDGSELPW